MNRKQNNEIKIETIEEYLSRGGRIKKVDFASAYKRNRGFCIGRSNYENNAEECPSRLQQHKERLETVKVIKKKIASNDI